MPRAGLAFGPGPCQQPQFNCSAKSSANGCNNCSAKGSATRRHVPHTYQQNGDNQQHEEVMLDVVAVWPSDHALRCRIVTSARFHVERINNLWLRASGKPQKSVMRMHRAAAKH